MTESSVVSMYQNNEWFLYDVRLWHAYHATTRRAIIDQWEKKVVKTIHLYSHQAHCDGPVNPPRRQYCETWLGGQDSYADSQISEVIS